MRRRVLALLAVPAAIGAWVALSSPAPSRPDPRAAAAAESANTTLTSAASASTSTDGTTSTDVAASASVTTSMSSTTSASAAGDEAVAHVIKTEPSGVRVALDAPLVVLFDRAPVQANVSLTIEPVAEGRTTWRDPQTLTFTPVRWAEGKPYRVRVAGAGVEPATFELRTLVPPPSRIEPGHGARMTLTFDDGADRPAQVTALLDLLAKEQVQAIFFPTGRWAEANPRLVLRMTEDGHRVCNHTYSHQNLRLPQLTEEEIRSEIARGAGATTCELFRPPLKAFDPRVERIIAAMGYKLYLWDIDSRDWEGAATEDIVNLVLARAHPEAVVLFHMHAQATLEALPLLLPRLRKAGYVFRARPDAGTDLDGGPDAGL